MAITPPSDIVLDVARAASPEKYRAAVERLARSRAAAPSAAVAAARQEQPTAQRYAESAPATSPSPLNLAPPHNSKASADAFGQFEAFVLQTFVQSMLPQNATTVFGKGTAGEVWKSMLAEKLGAELAKSGQVGIAKKLAAGTAPVTPPRTDIAAIAPVPASFASTIPYMTARPPEPAKAPDASPDAVAPPSQEG